MSKKVISTEKAPGAIGPYSQAIQIGNIVSTSGQLPIDMATGELMTDPKLATKASLDNVKAILEEAGTSMDKVFKTTVFVKDLKDFNDVNEVYATYFEKNPPARSCVQVAQLPKDAVVEIEALAIIE
ncbi:RidA family protein [Clostridioides mangenotii]|uniref:RidA family protein n=1 Tax=Metaclostridioides mangenotii TaxID=1540 RepID=UPI001C114FFB|nr:MULTISPECIES: RidA family protein [Clostridioides]MBS5787237.1 RidA family protein [Clostridioides difficile]MBU5307066.1 RidA family protein [Clostridioides mangenotii]MCR1955160.1 RidA family protein [Clostridioides mangenotii]